MRTITRGRGWRRIGIVSSVIWFVGFFAYVWIADVQHHDDFYISQLNSCLSILNKANEQVGSLDNPNDRAKFDGNWTKYKDCQAKASALFGTMVDASHSAPALAILIAIDLATVLIGWVVIGGVVLVLRWIFRDFASA